MKKTFTILFMIICSINFAQDSRLFENTWYLHDLIIDGSHTIPPINNEIPYIAAHFDEPDLFQTGVCEEQCSGTLIYNGTTEFSIQKLICLTGGCYENFPINDDFLVLYNHLFWGSTIDNDYLYSISEEGNFRSLIITNFNGDEAIYGNELLSINDKYDVSISITPNPVDNLINIQDKNNLSISKIKIFDINGKLVLIKDKIDTDFLSINVQTLNMGIYFITIENEINQALTKKIIKM